MRHCVLCYQNRFIWVDLCTHHEPHHLESNPCLVFSDRYIYRESLLFLLIFVFILCFCRWSTSTIHKSQLPPISGMNLSPAHKNLFTITFILNIYKQLLPVCSLDLFTKSLSLSIILILFQETSWFLMSLSFFIFGIAEDKCLCPASTLRKSQLPQIHF